MKHHDDRPGVVFSNEDYIYLDKHWIRMQQFKWHAWCVAETAILLALLIVYSHWRKMSLAVLCIPGTGLTDETASFIALLCCCSLMLLISLFLVRHIYDETTAFDFKVLSPFAIIGMGTGLCLTSFLIASDFLPCAVILCILLAIVIGVLATPACKLEEGRAKLLACTPAILIALVCCWGAAGLGLYGPFGSGLVCTVTAPSISSSEKASLDNENVNDAVRRVLDDDAFSELTLREKATDLAVLAQLHAKDLGLLEKDGLDVTPKTVVVKGFGSIAEAGYRQSDNTIIISIGTLEDDSKRVAEHIGHEMMHAFQYNYVNADDADREVLRRSCSYRIPNEKVTEQWGKELNDYKFDGREGANGEYYSQEIEKDAERYSYYSLWYIEEQLGIEISLPVPARILMDLSEEHGKN